MSSHRLRANAIRALSMDAVQQAKSGHPGMPMGMADIAEVLWTTHLKHNPQNPHWPNRDRFVLSNGHGSMLLYAVLHLSGYDVSMDDLKNFRQWGSKTPGHPEYLDTPGVETTTGPLGQGLANAVGMALAEKKLAAEFNRDGYPVIDHYTYVFAGDGCLMEGISHEACSLAGTFRLNKLIVFWDDNGISIDGEVSEWFSEDVATRFKAYGWSVIEGVDGHDATQIEHAIEQAQQHNAPTLICCKTTIGYGSPTKAGSASSHGSPLGEEEIQRVRQALGWSYAPFEVPDEVYSGFDGKVQGLQEENEWKKIVEAYRVAHPNLAAALERRLQRTLPNEIQGAFKKLKDEMASEGKAMATRQSSKQVLDAVAPLLPELLGGSADLSGSNCTRWQGATTLSAKQPEGQYIHYGVREFGMSAIMNGLCLHGGVLPFAGTFLVFMEYARNAVRMAALMHQPSIFVYSHDSIGLGEDGPTHQPVEQIANLRATPNLHAWRPCDGVETAVSWERALHAKRTPQALILSRQALPAMARTEEQTAQISQGGYVLYGDDHLPDAIAIATGSEVQLAIEAAHALALQGVRLRVVSMPCVDVFLEQDEAYRQHVLPDAVSYRIAIETGVDQGWYRFVGREGCVIGMNSFGASAPADLLFKHYGFTTEHVVKTVLEMIKK